MARLSPAPGTRIPFLLGLFVFFVVNTAVAGEPQRFQFAQGHMGALFRIVLYAPDETLAKKASDAAFARIAQLDGIMSDYKPDSELMLLCQRAGGDPVPVSADLFEVLNQSLVAARRSNGAFDITVGPLVRLWRLTRHNRELPPPTVLARAKELVGYDNVVLDEKDHTVRLLKPGMQLDLGGIGKGFANDKAMAVLKEQGITSALVVAGGEMTASAPPPGREGWTIGIAPLDNPDKAPSLYLLLRDGAISTSGDAEQFVEINGTRYSHILDPKTGLGLTGHSSVTVVAPNGTTSDWLATAVSVMGPEQGLKMVESSLGVAALILQATKDGDKVYESQRWKDVPKTGPKTEKAEPKATGAH
ncbi:MAG: FAD:protein FMN transferase [Planctomycetota bacterium]|nr:FAD:protein FMN transferase [Planctomycetota bacterium]